MRKPLAGIRIAEIGERVAVGACGTLLADLGAEVAVRGAEGRANKWVNRDFVLAGKARMPDAAAFRKFAANADVILVSSDIDGFAAPRPSDAQVLCDITAYGSTGPLGGVGHSDALVQAMCGLADTTGEPDGPPVLCGFAAAEGLGALHAAAAILAALRVRAVDGLGQAIEISLYESVFSGFASIVPFPLAGQPITRAGNRHVSASPWNVYPASDGPLVVCTATDEQWLRLCVVIGREDFAADAALARAPGRIAAAARIDRAIADWAGTQSGAQGAARLNGEGIPAGPIVPFGKLGAEPNIRHRGLLAAESGILRTAIRYFPASRADDGRVAPASAVRDALPLAGIRVLDLGQFTTAPFVARHLGALGADVVKVESPAGDASRAWTPRRDGLSYYFALSNSDKRSLCLDLRARADLERFRRLVTESDVLVENLKPGSLGRLGLSPDALGKLNPGLVYCAVSGFGADSAYPGRPAFDTVIQAMSGMMDRTRFGDVPQKVGLSLADIAGGLFGLVGVLASLYTRAAGMPGDHLDISMQDASAWIAQLQAYAGEPPGIVRCADGYAVVEAGTGVPTVAADRSAFVADCAGRGLAAAPVLSMGEVVAAPQTVARQMLVEAADAGGGQWPAFSSPLRLQRTPPRVRSAIGSLGEMNVPGTAPS